MIPLVWLQAAPHRAALQGLWQFSEAPNSALSKQSNWSGWNVLLGEMAELQGKGWLSLPGRTEATGPKSHTDFLQPGRL